MLINTEDKNRPNDCLWANNLENCMFKTGHGPTVTYHKTTNKQKICLKKCPNAGECFFYVVFVSHG